MRLVIKDQFRLACWEFLLVYFRRLGTRVRVSSVEEARGEKRIGTELDFVAAAQGPCSL